VGAALEALKGARNTAFIKDTGKCDQVRVTKMKIWLAMALSGAESAASHDKFGIRT
jgi:hypothetical protein